MYCPGWSAKYQETGSIMHHYAKESTARMLGPPEFPMRNWIIGTCAGDPSYLAGVQGHDFQHQHSQKTNCRKQLLVSKPNKCCSFQISETLLPPTPLKTNIKNQSVSSFHRDLQFLQVTNSRPWWWRYDALDLGCRSCSRERTFGKEHLSVNHDLQGKLRFGGDNYIVND